MWCVQYKATMEQKFKTFVGTLVYMSPERLNGEEYTPACDVWSLGISVMELAMGFHPLAKKQPYPPPVEKRDPRKPGWKSMLLRRCLVLQCCLVHVTVLC